MDWFIRLHPCMYGVSRFIRQRRWSDLIWFARWLCDTSILGDAECFDVLMYTGPLRQLARRIPPL